MCCIFSAYSVQLKAGALFGIGSLSLLSENVLNFGYLKVNCRNRLEQKMNMYSDFTEKQVRDKIILAPFFFIAVHTLPLKILSLVKGSSDLREGQF